MKQRCKSKKITPRQEQFCREYIIDLNATQASIRAGYSEKTASEMGYENLRKPQIAERIAALKQESIKRVRNERELELSADATLREMNSISQATLAAFFDINERGEPILNLIKAEELGLLGTLKKIKFKELPPIKFVEMGIEIERKVVAVELELWDKVGAGEKMMKHHGILKEKTEVDGMNELVKALQAGRDRVAKLREDREAQKHKNSL